MLRYHHRDNLGHPVIRVLLIVLAAGVLGFGASNTEAWFGEQAGGDRGAAWALMILSALGLWILGWVPEGDGARRPGLQPW